MFGLPAGLIEYWGKIWGTDGSGPYAVDRDGDVTLSAIPRRVYTDDGGEGPNSRIRVDVGQTGFFAGREFRTFKEFNQTAGTQIAVGATYVVKAVVPLNIILLGLEMAVDDGAVRVRTIAGGTEGGSFSEVLPIIACNSMSERPTPLYTPQVVITAGGTHNAAGTVFDVLRVRAANAAGSSSTVGANNQDERGVGAATAYFLIENIGTGIVQGVFRLRWEERPSGV